MKLPTFLLYVLFVFAGLGYSQTGKAEYEFGKPSELKGLTKVYVETMGDLKENERIVERLNKAKIPTLQIVEDVDAAEIILVFGGDNFSSVIGSTHTSTDYSINSSVTRINLLEGEGRVFVASADGKKARLIMRVQNEQESKWEKRPVTKFVDDFVKIYKKMNGIQ